MYFPNSDFCRRRYRVCTVFQVVMTTAMAIVLTPPSEKAMAQSAGTFSGAAAGQMGGGSGPQKQAGKKTPKKKAPKKGSDKATSSSPTVLPHLGITSKQGSSGYLY